MRFDADAPFPFDRKEIRDARPPDWHPLFLERPRRQTHSVFLRFQVLLPLLPKSQIIY
jgi:hypothetical protein